MTPVTRLLLAAGAIATLALETACDPFKCFDAITPPFFLRSSSAQLWIGDEFQIDGTAGVDCERSVSTKDNWSAFTFTSDTPSVAAVDHMGVIRGGVGQTRVRVRHASGSGSVDVLVSEPIATVTVTFSPASAKPGDTVTVTVQAITAAGQPTTRIQMDNKILLRRNGATAAWAFLAGATPFSARFVARDDGAYEVTSTAKRSVGTPRAGVATLTVPAG